MSEPRRRVVVEVLVHLLILAALAALVTAHDWYPPVEAAVARLFRRSPPQPWPAPRGEAAKRFRMMPISEIEADGGR